jgi:hypothetical protein
MLKDLAAIEIATIVAALCAYRELVHGNHQELAHLALEDCDEPPLSLKSLDVLVERLTAPGGAEALLREEVHYGSVSRYPANELAEQITNLTRTKTLTPVHVQYVKAMGFTVRIAGKEGRTL